MLVSDCLANTRRAEKAKPINIWIVNRSPNKLTLEEYHLLGYDAV
jgi:hypothetical protein